MAIKYNSKTLENYRLDPIPDQVKRFMNLAKCGKNVVGTVYKSNGIFYLYLNDPNEEIASGEIEYDHTNENKGD